MKKIVSIIILLAIAVIGSKFYLEYRYKSELDKAIRQVSAYAEVMYEDLEIGFDGTIKLVELRITPNSGFNTFSVKSVEVAGFGLMDHLNAKSRLAIGDLPPMVKLNVSQLKFPASVYEDLATRDHKVCRSFESSILYSLAGVEDVIYNATLEFDLLLPDEANINLTAFDQISNSSFSMSFNPLQANVGSALSGANPINSFEYTYSLDQIASTSIVSKCADVFKVSQDQFLNTVVGSNQYLVNSFGFNPGETAKNALGEFLRGGKTLSVRANPGQGLNITTLNGATPVQIMRALGVSVSLEGDPVPISYFNSGSQVSKLNDVGSRSDIAETEGFKRRDLEDLLNGPDDTVQRKSKSSTSRRRKAQYDVASLVQVDEYVDREVRVSRTNDRSVIEGRLLDVEDKVLSIEMFRYGGTMIYTVPYEDVSRLEIKRSKR